MLAGLVAGEDGHQHRLESLVKAAGTRGLSGGRLVDRQTGQRYSTPLVFAVKLLIFHGFGRSISSPERVARVASRRQNTRRAMASVSLVGVTKVYAGGLSALAGLDLEIQDREFLVLLGPSGCGKSTTLRLIAGLEEVTAGEIRIGARVVNRVPPKDRDIAMVFQNYALYPHMTVYQNLAFGLRLRYGGSWLARFGRRWWDPQKSAELDRQRREIPARVRQVASGLGIESLLGRLPRQLSGGERQRVALGRAMVRQPAVFLFDEPLSNLDAKLRVETRRELKQLHGRLQATMIYVTHDQVEALTLGQRIAVMDRGVVQQVGSPLEVYDWPRNLFVAGFIGSPPMNLVRGELCRREGVSWFVAPELRCPLSLTEAVGQSVSISAECPVGLSADCGVAWPTSADLPDGAQVVLGFRPEQVRLGPPGGLLQDAGEVGWDRLQQAVEGGGVVGASSAGRLGTGRVCMTESLGDATLVHVEMTSSAAGCKNSSSVVVCKEPVRTSWRVGELVAIFVATGCCHLFHGTSGQRIAAVTVGAVDRE